MREEEAPDEEDGSVQKDSVVDEEDGKEDFEGSLSLLGESQRERGEFVGEKQQRDGGGLGREQRVEADDAVKGVVQHDASRHAGRVPKKVGRAVLQEHQERRVVVTMVFPRERCQCLNGESVVAPRVWQQNNELDEGVKSAEQVGR